jgi:all-trans-8'-apo-beta-carotenal 15,15'-oxygenase
MGDDELYALWEAGAPFQMDPTTLETIGESTLYGAVDGKDNTRYAAHYKIDPRNNNICGFSVLPGDKDPSKSHKLCVMEHIDKKLLYKKYYPFDGLGVAHDCSITENYFAFLQSPFEINPLPLILGLKGAAECIQLDDSAETSNIILIPRGDNRKEPIIIQVPPYFSFHSSNAFEDENGHVVIDMIVAKSKFNSLAGAISDATPNGYPTKPSWEGIDWKNDVPPNELLRVRLDPNQGKLVSQHSLTEECATVEFPVVNPKKLSRPYTYVYCATSASANEMSPLQGLAKFNVETGQLLEKWLPEPDQYITEVAFCPKANSDKEDDGYLMTYILDPKKRLNELLVFDAANPGKGPISRAPLQGWSVNHSLHGVFVPGFAPGFSDQVKASFEQT